jgi:3',5'-nucleoside bisphosphate phosphatase
MIIEMHCHTREHSSCSNVAAADLAQSCFDKGLQGLVFTDHHYLWPAEEIRALRRRLAVPDYFLLLTGQEVTTADFGDILIYGATRSFSRGTSLDEIRQGFPDAALVWAHPYRHDNHPSPERLTDQRLNGVEIFNSNHSIAEITRGLRDWHRFKFIALAGTDTHAASYTATYPTVFDHPVPTVAELATEIRHGRCRPYFMEIPRAGTSDTLVTELDLGVEDGGRCREMIVIKDHENPEAWKSARQTARVMEAIGRCGFEQGMFRIPRPLGHDPETLTTIEQGIKGKNLFDRLLEAERGQARRYLKMAAQWLARLHNCRLQVTPPAAWLENEPKRLERYVSALSRMNHPHTRKGEEIMNFVLEAERNLYLNRPDMLVQGHGDFHLKNILIGLDNPEDQETCYVAAIDFDSSYSMPPAFDVGTFLAQFQNQFFNFRQVRQKVSPELFLATYLDEIQKVEPDFSSQVELFKARTSLSIIYYLVKVGLGESENLWRVMVEAEQSLTRLAFQSSREQAPKREPSC